MSAREFGVEILKFYCFHYVDHSKVLALRPIRHPGFVEELEKESYLHILWSKPVMLMR